MVGSRSASYSDRVSDLQDTLDAIDTLAVHCCGYCDEPLAVNGPSPDFCDSYCQLKWTARQAEVAELIGYREPDDLPAHASNLVELSSPEVTPPGWPCPDVDWVRFWADIDDLAEVAVYEPSGTGLFQVVAPDPRYYQMISDPDGATWWAPDPPVNGRQRWWRIRRPR